ncbi:hypothetical protein H5410_056821 [Solanum commersonii]|uniref:CCHC-type domain-containing protein n=1 Tax=Solanum commersonii TaxID=4109 RepID=A0A9J5WNC4_SOLCO|nr:hypothetical protein H5410_056821 [Solanum commersonii]
MKRLKCNIQFFKWFECTEKLDNQKESVVEYKIPPLEEISLPVDGRIVTASAFKIDIVDTKGEPTIKDIKRILQLNNYTNQLLYVVSNQILEADNKSIFKDKPSLSYNGKNKKIETPIFNLPEFSNEKFPRKSKLDNSNTDTCWNCGKTRHHARDYRAPNKKKDKINMLELEYETKNKLYSILDENQTSSERSSSEDDQLNMIYSSADYECGGAVCTCQDHSFIVINSNSKEVFFDMVEHIEDPDYKKKYLIALKDRIFNQQSDEHTIKPFSTTNVLPILALDKEYEGFGVPYILKPCYTNQNYVETEEPLKTRRSSAHPIPLSTSYRPQTYNWYDYKAAWYNFMYLRPNTHTWSTKYLEDMKSAVIPRWFY